MLKEHPEWGRFFRDFQTLELGKKISEGAQADIYEARMKSDGPFNLVAKVMKGDVPLQAFQAQWPIGMLSAYNSKFVSDLPLMTILGGTVLAERRLWGRFAFVMYRRWGDLRLLIDRRMKHKHTSVGPFFTDQVIQLMLRIGEDMEGLHNKYDIIHRDLKASNVLVWGEFGDDVNVVAPSQGETIGSVVADFECSMGVMGTGWWRAPEILQQLREKVPSSKVQFTRKSDIYSYGMTCYEIVSGYLPFGDKSASEASHKIVFDCTPYEDQSVSEASYMSVSGCLPFDVSKTSEENEASYMSVSSCLPSDVSSASEESEACHEIVSIDEVLNGRRPYLPIELPTFLRTIIVSCWQSDPEKRPSFSDICKILKNQQGCNPDVVIDNESYENATIIKVKQWDNLHYLPLLQALERLLQMPLFVWRARILQRHNTAGMFVLQFEVTDYKGRKVRDENGIANIVKVLSVPFKVEWIIGESDGTDFTANWLLGSHIHIIGAIGGPWLLGSILAILIELRIQLFKLKCWSDDSHVHCEMYMKGTKVDLLLSQILTRVAGSEVCSKVIYKRLTLKGE